ncbi:MULTISPECIES: metallophosphoesterase family protein [Sphingobacterium]|uniref:metallophosphoesterase family protein n=1 Tax=Sphingobacterium TaxID=28453 RepID=UPI0008A0FC99|nr:MULTISPECIES: metallophosphoesterase family protein [Sphingobacterium]MBB1642671.1 YfcE family phosphodiesterase [Sphingobacterium sp. UME9]OFV09535.1 serine/threonine protein phosphatase [Sphingobacterium sp. HMSC13C05]
MKIAFFSDIHANLPAFEAMLQDMDQQKPDSVYCLGDLIGYHIWPNEVIAEIRRRNIATIAGNHDLKVHGLETTEQDLKEGGKKYAYHIINDGNRSYLKSLPAHIKLEYQQNSDKLNLVLAHGSTRKVDEYVLADTDEAYVLDMMLEADADLLFVGHSHKPYHRVIQAADNKFKHVINTGSVGKPKDGDPRGCYVLVTLSEESSALNSESIQIEFRRFDYDIEKAAITLEQSLLPSSLADMLRLAY